MWGKVLGAGKGRRPAPLKRIDGESDQAFLERLARVHLPAEVADRWLTLLRPAVKLVPAADNDPVVARLGGHPQLPEDVAWPIWTDTGRSRTSARSTLPRSPH